jgi:hypothetical protein
MTSLRELQQRFGAALFERRATGIESLIRADGIAALERLDVYRGNLEANFRKALASEYPVIERLVGGPYFTELAARFLEVEPSRSGDLQHIGRGFAAFLSDRFTGSRHAYFADVAALEWAYHEVLVAADPPPFAPESLASFPVERYLELQFPALSCARLLHSQFPVLRIWLANQPFASSGEMIDLEAGPEWALVCRSSDGRGIDGRGIGGRGMRAALHPLDAPSYAFAEALVAGLTLEEAYDRAVAQAELAGAQFDLAGELRLLVARGVVGAPRLLPRC